MAYLFVDCSKHLVVGLLNDGFNWSEYVEVKDAKTSAQIHLEIFNILKKQNVEIKDLAGIFVVSGPGSYTGVRVAEGLAQVLEWQDIPIYSFNHFQIPNFIGDDSWAFVSKAFKGEFFLYEKNGETRLYKLEDFDKTMDELKVEKIYTHFKEDLPENFDFFYTSFVIKDKPGLIFKKVLKEKMRSRPYYYRPLEKEFKVKNNAQDLSK